MITIFNKRYLLTALYMSDLEQHIIKRNDQDIDIEVPQKLNSKDLLMQILNDPSLKVCYKCGTDFNKERNLEDDTETNNMLFGGIVLSEQTPSSICLNCLSSKIVDSITDRFVKTNKDYSGLFNTYTGKLKV